MQSQVVQINGQPTWAWLCSKKELSVFKTVVKSGKKVALDSRLVRFEPDRGRVWATDRRQMLVCKTEPCEEAAAHMAVEVKALADILKPVKAGDVVVLTTDLQVHVAAGLSEDGELEGDLSHIGTLSAVTTTMTAEHCDNVLSQVKEKPAVGAPRFRFTSEFGATLKALHDVNPGPVIAFTAGARSSHPMRFDCNGETVTWTLVAMPLKD